MATFNADVSQPEVPYLPAHPLRQRLLVAFVGLVLIAAAAWLALIIVSRIDDLFFPGQGIAGLPNIPGVDTSGDDEGTINILIMGLDRRPREGNIPTRTDTMFVLTIDKKTKSAGILGIPRDLWVEIPTKTGSSYYEQRINTAYAAGATQDYPGGGAGLVKRVIEHNLGVPIDHYVVIDFQGFVKIIDDLGGIDVYVEEEVDDPYYSQTELPGDYYPLHFEIGLTHMDGQMALDYSRTRFDSSDLDRIQRQQQVIFAAIDKALERRLVSVDSLMSQWRRYKGAIETDINDIQAPGFASLAAQIEPTDIAALSLGPATVPYTTADGAAVLLIDKKIVQQIVSALFSGQPVAETMAVVEVQNGSGTDGLATEVASYLTDFGFSSDSVSATNGSDGTLRPLTEIIDFTGKNSTAQRLANLLGVPIAQVRPATTGDRTLATVANADVLIVLGQDVQDRNFSIDSGDETPGPG